MTQEDKLLGEVLKSFNKEALHWIAIKEKDLSVAKDKNGNVHLNEKFLRSFCNRESDDLKPFVPHKTLEEFALIESLKDEYPLLNQSDIYFILSYILMNLYNFLLWDRDDINVIYQSGLGHFAFQSQLLIKPNFKKPKRFLDFCEDKSFNLFKQVMKETFFDANEKYKEVHFHFELVLNSQVHSDDQEITIGERVKISVKNNEFKITANYKGNPAVALDRMEIDLSVILSILEMNGVLHIEDTEKRLGAGSMKLGLIDDQKIKFKFGRQTLTRNTSLEAFKLVAVRYEEHFKRFKESAFSFIPLHYFSLLSEKFDRDASLRIIPQFFSSENFRFPRTEFLNYWTALEILLGNPARDIIDSLIKAYELFYPEEKNIKMEDKTLSKLWRIRNKMIHEGRLHVEQKEIWTIKKLVEAIFDKILLARMTDKFYFTIQTEGQLEMEDL